MRRFPKQARSKEKVDAIVKAATVQLREVGYEALKTADIAKAAGVSVGTLYQFFDNKDDLMLAIAENHMHKMQSFRNELFGPDAIYVPHDVLLSRSIDWLVQHNKENPTFEQIFHDTWTDVEMIKAQKMAMGAMIADLGVIIKHNAGDLSADKIQVGASLLIYTTKTMFALLSTTEPKHHDAIIAQTKRMMLIYFNDLIGKN